MVVASAHISSVVGTAMEEEGATISRDRPVSGFLTRETQINGPVGKRQNYCIYQMCLRNGGL
jgi:hypothetical protein